MYENSKISTFPYMKLYGKHFFHTMKLYEKHFSINEIEVFCHKKTQSVTGRYHADNLQLVILAMNVKFNIFTWNYLPK